MLFGVVLHNDLMDIWNQTQMYKQAAEESDDPKKSSRLAIKGIESSQNFVNRVIELNPDATGVALTATLQTAFNVCRMLWNWRN